MGIFSSKKSESIEVGEFVEMLASAKNDRERRKLLYSDGAKKKFNLTAKDLKKAEKLTERVTQGEKGIKAAAAGILDIVKGKVDSNNSEYTKMIREAAQQNRHRGEKPPPPMHPSEWKQRVRSGKIQPSASEAARIKKSDPALYQQILDREVKRRGL